MSHAKAMAEAMELRAALLDHGVKRVSIEIQPGRPGTPNAGWYAPTFIACLGHHIVSTRAQGLTPGLALVKRGRSDVPGPLCNGYGGFDEVARIICMGWANHPGAGGPWDTPSKGVIPRDGGRPYIFGWEHEGGVRASDWTDSFRAFMGRCHAGTLDYLNVDERSYGEHKTWAPDRKIDRLGYTTTSGRVEARRYRDTQPPGDDDVAVDDVRIGVFQMADEAANRSTATGRQYGDDWAKMIRDAISPLEQKVDAILLALQETAPPVP